MIKNDRRFLDPQISILELFLNDHETEKMKKYFTLILLFFS